MIKKQSANRRYTDYGVQNKYSALFSIKNIDYLESLLFTL